GEWLMQVLRGGADVSGNTLYRFFALHVVILPLATFAVVGVHLLFIQRQGMAPPRGHAASHGMRFFPDFALRDVLLWLLCLLLLASLAVFLPYGPRIPGVEWELGRKANPLAPAYPGIKPEWYFLWKDRGPPSGSSPC
ncbi:MAG: cytochrome B, partial [Deltaproteobacteria bacterium]